MIEVVAIEMRERLGLEPWELFAARAKVKIRAHYRRFKPQEPAPDPDRATGRSTRDAVRALARCWVQDIGTIHVVGDRHDFQLVQDLVNRLGLPIRVVSGDRYWGTVGGVLVHQDHHAAEMDRRRRLRADLSPHTGW